METKKIVDLIRQIYNREGKVPDLIRMSKLTGEGVDKIKKVYKHYLLDGKINMAMTDDDVHKVQVKKEIKEEPVKVKESVKTINLELLIKIVVGFVGILFTMTSIHFTFNFNKQSMNSFWAFVLSLGMISFTSFAFTFASYVKDKRTKIIVYFLYALGVSYSIFTAIGGQFKDFQSYTLSDEVIESEQEYDDDLDKEIKYYESQIAELDKDIKDEKERNNGWFDKRMEYTNNPSLKEENGNTWKDIQNSDDKSYKNLEDLKIEKSRIETRLEELRQERRDRLRLKESEKTSEESTVKETIYHWLASLFKIKSSWIHFIVIVFPSVFIDLCSGICLKFAFFHKKEESNS